MIGLARLYCRKQCPCRDFKLVDVPVKEAKYERLKLEQDNWVVYHTEIV